MVLFLLGLGLFLPGSHLLPLLDRDEPRFARATVEMVERGEWVVPYFNNEYRFDKPVLTYWLMRGGYALFGQNEFGARFHSAVSASLLAAVIFLMGRRWFGARAGLLAGFGMLTCFQMAVHGRSAVADMPMVLFVCLAMWAMAELLGIRPPGPGPGPADESGNPEPAAAPPAGKWFWLFHLSLGLGFLAKGPIALIVPLLAALLWRFALWRKPAPWRNLRLLSGLPILLLIVGAWGIPALVKTGGLFWKVGIGEHVVDRGMTAFNGRFPFPLYYVFTMFVSLFPWCFFVREAWRAGRGRLGGGKTALDTYLAAWFLAPLLVFSLYSTQLMHYIMPGFPAFFFLLVRAWAARDGAGRAALQGRMLRAGAAAGVFFLVLVFAAGLLLRPRTPAVQLRDFLTTRPAATEFGFYRFREPSLVFYSGRPFEKLGSPQEALAFLGRPGPRLLVQEERSQKILSWKPADDRTAEVSQIPTNGCEVVRVAGVNVAQGRFVTVRAVFKP